MSSELVQATSNGEGPTSSSEPVIRVRDLYKYFPITKGIVFDRTIGNVQAVNGVDLDVYRGETLGIVGESGCGKSTLAGLLMGLERPTSGSIEVLGKDIARMKPKQLREARKDVQIVLQDPYTSLNPRMTVGDIVGEPFGIHNMTDTRKERDRRVADVLDTVGLDPKHRKRYPHEFSGGQRQRIGIARALALRPDVIICDEPVSALDVSVQAQVINLLEELQDEFGLSYIFIAHDISVVRHICDRIAVMYLGNVVEVGTDEEICDHPTHPYTQALLSAVPLPDPTTGSTKQRITLSGDVPSPADPPSGCRFRTRCWKAEDICAREMPELTVRSGSEHPSRCHFAEEQDIMQATKQG